MITKSKNFISSRPSLRKIQDIHWTEERNKHRQDTVKRKLTNNY